jgi:hypothetical protein
VAASNVKPPVKQDVKTIAQQLHDKAITGRATKLWDTEANKEGSVLEQFGDLHPDAQALVKDTAKKLFKGDTLEPQMVSKVMQEHVDAVARDNAKNRPPEPTMAEREATFAKQEHQGHVNRIEAAAMSTNIHLPTEHKEMMLAINSGDFRGTLDAIARNTKLSEPLRELARAMQNMASLAGVKIEFAKIIDKPGRFTAGRYDSAKDLVQINKELMQHESPRPTDEVIAHEVMHALTSRKIQEFESRDALNAEKKLTGGPRDEQYKHTEEYKSYQKLVAIQAELAKDYRAAKEFSGQIRNVREMISEAFSNPEFQKYLASLPYANPKLPKVTNAWQGFIGAVKNLLGFKGPDNALNVVLTHAARVADSYKGEAPKDLKGEVLPLEMKREKPFSKSVPKDATIMLEHADGKEHEHNARQAMRKAEQHKNVMDMLKECLGA